MANIMIIEDNLHNARLAARLLRRSGHSVTVVDTGEAGLLTALASANSETTLDVILIDLGLPDIDGQTVIALLAQQPHLAATRLVAFTAWPAESAYNMATAYGCHGVILKPINTRQFVGQVEAFLRPKPADAKRETPA
jgi:CheY-like chemotaxis protein